MDSHVVHGLNWGQSDPSVRSRASSVISTGTKFSISTLPREDVQNIELSYPGPSSANRPRPHSLISLASYDQPAPAYNDREVSNILQEPSNQHEISASGQLPSPAVDMFDVRSIPTESENALSIHYGRIVRTIDQKYADDLLQLTQSHERELAAIRHEIDQAYRKEWKTKNREVEKFREEANTHVADIEAKMEDLACAHEETVERIQRDFDERMAELAEVNEITIDKARNAIEDLWEQRWSDRTRLAVEETRRVDLENQRKLEKAVADRDDEWVRELGNRHPELLDELKDTINGLRAGK